MSQLPDNIIGLGLYTPAEAALYARVPAARFRRWVFGTAKAQPVIDPQLGRVAKPVATFLDLAQSLSINDVRISAELPLQKIRQAYDRARRVHQVEYPFAMKHGAFLFGDVSTPASRKRCEIGIWVESANGPQSAAEFREMMCVQLTGKSKGNLLMTPVVQEFSKKLVFGDGGVAREYEAYRKHGVRIVIDPEVRFGQPFLEDYGYEAMTLYDAVNVENSVPRAASMYRVPEAAVKAAFEYVQSLGKPSPTMHDAA